MEHDRPERQSAAPDANGYDLGMDEIATANAIDANMDAHTGCKARSNPECRPDVTQECAQESEEAEHHIHLSGLDH